MPDKHLTLGEKLDERFQNLPKEEEKFFSLLKRFCSRAVYYKLGMMEDSFLASDIAGDIYMRLDKFSNKSRFSTWVRGIANNKIADHLREKYVSSQLIKFKSLEACGEITDSHSFEDIDTSASLNSLMKDLDSSERAFVRLRVEGLSFEEIGEKLRIPTSSAYATWRTILPKLENRKNASNNTGE